MATVQRDRTRFNFGRWDVCAVCGDANPRGARCNRCAIDQRLAAAIESLREFDDDDANDQVAVAIEHVLINLSARPPGRAWSGAIRTAPDPILPGDEGEGDDYC